MKLRRLKVDGFGPLRGEFVFDPERVTLLVDENERGKSSLLAAITAGLYGLENDHRSHRVLTPVERWRPWDGGAFGLELEIESNDEHYRIRRDFHKGTVEVWNGDGREVTADFRNGKDSFPVGQKLLGLDEAEWEKVAFIRQSDLAEVVPADEKTRRSSSLRARLENAADTHVGDTNATEAIRVIDGAIAAYTSDELGSTMRIENVIKALEAKHGIVETEIAALENDLNQISGPLEELARRGDDERNARQELKKLEAEKREAMSGQIRKQIESNDERREQLERLRDEARSLSGVSHLSAGAEAELRETIARHEEAQRNLDALEARRTDELDRERKTLLEEKASLEAFEQCGADDADRFVALAAEIRRIGEADSRLKDTVFNQREALAGRGYEPERIQALTQKFDGLDDKQQRLLRSQAEMALGFQTEVAALEQARTESTETLREIDGQRNARRLPGWFLLALGLGGAVAGIVVMAIGGLPQLWNGLLIGALVLVLGGSGLVFTGSKMRADDRESALRRLSEAQRRLNQIRVQRAEAEVGLNEMCESMGYRDPVELMREWSEYARLIEDSAPVIRAQDGISALEAQRKSVLDEVREMVEHVGGGSPDPTNLERIAAQVRHLWAVKQRLEDLDQSWSWIDDEKRVAEAAAAGLKERAVRILQSAGLTYDPERAWVDHVADLNERLRGKSRHALLAEELIPQAERSLLSEAELEEKRKELSILEGERDEGEGPVDGPSRSQVEIEAQVRRVRDRLETVQKWRADLRLGVEETWRRHHRERPEKQAEIQRLAQALERARRFERSATLARETIQKVAVSTHRRWAEHLNQRVGELLQSVGTEIEEVRFGDDLDFSVRTSRGPQIARGKAIMQMSSGAQDQLHLLVRLAVSEYLSKGPARLPLLIDDVFATSDDGRARAGMMLLIEHFAAEHQIVVVTCHRRRHDALADLDGELYRERVQRLDVTSVTPARS